MGASSLMKDQKNCRTEGMHPSLVKTLQGAWPGSKIQPVTLRIWE